jgi:hypothetical protein
LILGQAAAMCEFVCICEDEQPGRLHLDTQGIPSRS